jgi:prophage DNA circulation protein
MSTSADFALSAQALAAAVFASAIDPADALRMLSTLADFSPAMTTSTAPIGKSIATLQAATGDLFRRSAVIAMARASSNYQPSSYDDAANVRSFVCELLDAEIAVAGDQGEDQTFNALRALRAAVADDLTQRGASLAKIMTVHTGEPMPAPVLAQRLYRDPLRTDELIAAADSPHPAFLAPTFLTLST